MKKELLGVPFDISNNDIIPNDISTYPTEMVSILNNQTNFENGLYEFFMTNDYNIICWHATRLTEIEIADIKKNGINTDDEPNFFERKINNLPSKISFEIKQKLLAYVKSLKETRSEGKVFASYGVFDLDNDYREDKIFLENWGGETIYCYYDTGSTVIDDELNHIKQELRSISFPCIVCLRISIFKLLETNNYFFDCFCNNLKCFDIKEISGNLCSNKKCFEVVDVLRIKNINI